MFTFFKRLKTITEATLNDLLDKAEDPVKMLNQYLRDMGEEINTAEVAVAKQIAVEKKLKQQLDDAVKMVEKREQQALRALEAGNEDLARRALEDKRDHQERVNDFQSQHSTAKETADKLVKQLDEMKREYEKMKNKKDTLIARAEAAKAKKQINKVMGSIGTDTGARGFERMSDKVMQMEAEAEASVDLTAKNRSLDDELDALGPTEVDAELEALKQRLASKNSSAAETKSEENN